MEKEDKKKRLFLLAWSFGFFGNLFATDQEVPGSISASAVVFFSSGQRMSSVYVPLFVVQ